jgi:hypothetical protein
MLGLLFIAVTEIGKWLGKRREQREIRSRHTYHPYHQWVDTQPPVVIICEPDKHCDLYIKQIRPISMNLYTCVDCHFVSAEHLTLRGREVAGHLEDHVAHGDKVPDHAFYRIEKQEEVYYNETYGTLPRSGHVVSSSPNANVHDQGVRPSVRQS